MDSTIWHSRGISFAKLGHYENAIRCYNEAIAIDPSHLEIYVDKGDLLYRIGKPEEALLSYDKYLDAHPFDTFVLGSKAAILKKIGKYTDAHVYYEKIITIDLTHFDMRQKKYEDQCNDRGGDDSDIYCDEEATREWQELIEDTVSDDYDASVHFYDEDTDPASDLEEEQLKKEQLEEESQPLFDETIRIAAEEEGRRIEFEVEDWKRYCRYLEDEAKKQKQDEDQYYHILDEEFKRQDNYDDAIKAYDEAIRLNPKYSKDWCNKGIALSAEGKHDDAIKAYDKAIRLDPKYSKAWSYKGVALTNQANTTKLPRLMTRPTG